MIIIALIIGFIIGKFTSHQPIYQLAKITDKSFDGLYWFYVMEEGVHTLSEPKLIEVSESVYEKFEVGEWINI